MADRDSDIVDGIVGGDEIGLPVSAENAQKVTDKNTDGEVNFNNSSCSVALFFLIVGGLIYLLISITHLNLDCYCDWRLSCF